MPQRRSCGRRYADGASLDVARASARDGLDAWFDVNRWLQAKMEIAPQAAMMYGELTARLIAAARGKYKKCLVLDLDNTLWGGVIGDDGIEGIVLGKGSGVGEAFLAVQAYAKTLSERGVLLACARRTIPHSRKRPSAIIRRCCSNAPTSLRSWRTGRQGREPGRHCADPQHRPRQPGVRG